MAGGWCGCCFLATTRDDGAHRCRVVVSVAVMMSGNGHINTLVDGDDAQFVRMARACDLGTWRTAAENTGRRHLQPAGILRRRRISAGTCAERDQSDTSR